ncbi:MAG: WbqC family protein [Clostridia bacterium]|nr:WbqC family protein [Clostridia bacterium]
MRLGMMQPYFFPYLGYWQLMNLSDEYIIYDDVNYIKGGWINRNRIKINGEPALFGLSIHKASQNRLINEHTISMSKEDKTNLIHKIEFAYKKAPYYSDVMSLFTEIMWFEDDNLAGFLANCNRKTADYLGIKTPIYSATEMQLDHAHRAQQRIIDICHERGCDEYTNAIGGKELYDKNTFEQNGIKLSFLHMDSNIVYPQGDGEFLPDLSILDVLMYNSLDEIKELLGRYTLE